MTAMLLLYEILLLTGALGLVAMALAGFVHVGGHNGPGLGPHAGHGGLHAGGHHGSVLPDAHGGLAHHAGPHAHVASHAGEHGGHEVADSRGGLGSSLLALLSPLTLFAACLGAGAVGWALLVWGVSVALSAAGAAIGAVVFNALLVRPIMRLVFGFASTPARGLTGTLMEEAEAVTAFDANGEGLVRVLVDGQSVDVLARLCDEERRQGIRIRRGERVRVEDVDARRNQCTVSRL